MSFYKVMQRGDTASTSETLDRFIKESKALPNVHRIIIQGKFLKGSIQGAGQTATWRLGTDETLRAFAANIFTEDTLADPTITAVSIQFELNGPNRATDYAFEVLDFCKRLMSAEFEPSADTLMRFEGADTASRWWTEMIWRDTTVALSVQPPLISTGKKSSRDEGYARTGGW